MLQTHLSYRRKWRFWIIFECIFQFSLLCQRAPTSNGSWLQTGHHSLKLDTSTFTGSTAVVTLQEPQQDRTNREPTPVSMPKSLPLLPIGPPKWSQSFIRVLDSHFHPLLLTSLIISVLRKHRLVIRNPEWACHTHMHVAASKKVVFWKKSSLLEKKRGESKEQGRRRFADWFKLFFATAVNFWQWHLSGVDLHSHPHCLLHCFTGSEEQ